MKKLIQGIYQISDCKAGALEPGAYVFRRCEETDHTTIEVLLCSLESKAFSLTEEKPECQLALTYDDRLYLSSTFVCEKL